MTAPVTPLEALEDLIDQITGVEFRDRHGHPIENNQAYLVALEVLADRRPEEARSFGADEVREDGSRH